MGLQMSPPTRTLRIQPTKKAMSESVRKEEPVSLLNFFLSLDTEQEHIFLLCFFFFLNHRASLEL